MQRRVTVLLTAGLVAALAAGCSSGSTGSHPSASSAGRSRVVAVPTTSARTTPTRRPTPAATATTASPTRTATPTPTPTHHRRTASALPLSFSTGNARQVITVVAGSEHDTTATLQAWHRVSGGWRRHGPALEAWLGSDGLTKHASESKSATPIGSFTLTRAFGHDANPGTRLPYTHTTPSYWWISQSGRLYNTMQDCSSGCAFTPGDPNEHLYYETPYYDYAAVIDYNTHNAPGGVRQGAGSAFFLHVTVGKPTQGCVSIPKQSLVDLLQWLNPAKHPRIVIGIG